MLEGRDERLRKSDSYRPVKRGQGCVCKWPRPPVRSAAERNRRVKVTGQTMMHEGDSQQTTQ